MLKHFCRIFCLFYILFIHSFSYKSNAQETFEGKEYLDSVLAQLMISDSIQDDKLMLMASSHLMDTLIHFDDDVTSCYYTMAYICRGVQIIGQTDYKKGMDFFEKALEANKNCGNINYDIKSLNGLGTYCALYLTPDRAIPYFERADSIRKSNEMDYMSFKLNYNLALAYNDNKNGNKALEYLKFAEEIILEENDSFRLAAIYHGYALNYDLIKKYAQAEVYHEKAIDFQPFREGPQIRYYYSEYINFLKKHNKLNKAFKFQSKLNGLLSDLVRFYKTKLDDELNLNYSDREKLFKAEKQNLQNQLAIEKAENRDQLITVTWVVILLISIMLIYSIFNLKKQKKLGRLLNSQNDRLESSKQAAQELLKLKTQFSETVSHELRTPLHGIIGLTDILLADEKQNLTEKGQKYLDSLKFSGDYLLNLINDVLEYSKLDAKKIKLENTAFNIEFLVSNLSSAFKHLMGDNEVQFNIKFDEKIPSVLVGDSVRLSQILINLIGNAFKFTEKGEVNLRLIDLGQNDEKVRIKFEIEDTGVGIPLSKQKMIFEKFIQINEVNSGVGGTGLGLSIVKQLLELFKSHIHLKSEVNKGTLFWFEIEFERGDESEAIFLDEPIQKPDRIIEGGRILIVDDNHINLIVSENILEKNNYEVVTCDNGFSAIQFIESDEFDLVLMDLHMPKLDGAEATKLIKEINQDIPIILLTASNVLEDWKKYEEMGFEDYIIKPYDKGVFLKKVSMILRNVNREE